MANYAIGDIQGCYDSLCRLLEVIQFDKHSDTLWIAGDLVNRGPKSLETLRYLKSLGDTCHVVLGNHDLHMIGVAYSCAPRKPKDTFFDVLDAYDSPTLIDWLRKQSLVRRIEVNDKVFLLSHAGIPPIWSAQQALDFSREVEQMLSSNNAIDFLNVMYGNEPDTWSDELSGNDRLRVITNYFTRMRFCNEQGQLELTAKTPSGEAPEGFKPWYEIVNPHINNEKIIFGHWAALEGKTGKKNIFAIDTGCVWGNRLTALRLEDEQLFSVNAVEAVG
jgi:bis(5'-nucleosyl)-tetraphosphatase (symmetrical)